MEITKMSTVTSMLMGKSFSNIFFLLLKLTLAYHAFYKVQQTPLPSLIAVLRINQDAFRKDDDQSFVVLKIKFQILNNPINLHHRDGIYYVVMATIYMCNMMVEARWKRMKWKMELCTI